MDSLEAKAYIFAAILRKTPETWGKAESDAAAKLATSLLAAKKITPEVFADIMPDIAGNHSATRQKFQAMGFIERKETDSALRRQIQAQIETLNKAEDAELEKVGKAK